MTAAVTATRRSLFASGLALLLVLSLAPVAVAAELEDVLAQARESTFTASRLVVSVWGGQVQVSREHVEYANGMETVHRDASWSMVGNGKAISMGAEPTGVSYLTEAAPMLSSRYTIIEVGDALHLSRPCQIIMVMEGDIHRATFLVDTRSGALLVQNFFTDTGRLYRRTTLTDFRPYRTYPAPMDGSHVPVEIVMQNESDRLPQSVAGYELVDAFSAPEQGYYSDGFFSFSLFILGRTAVSGFEDPMVFTVDSGVYDMVPTARDVALHWSDGSNNYVLVGNLPPDHLVDVLGDLPSPEPRGVWARWWQKIFR